MRMCRQHYPRKRPDYVVELNLFLNGHTPARRARYTMPPTDAPFTWRAPGCLRRDGAPGAFNAKNLDGATSISGPIYIDNELRDEDNALRAGSVWRRLLPVAAHELFHYVQRYNPSFPTWFYEAARCT